MISPIALFKVKHTHADYRYKGLSMLRDIYQVAIAKDTYTHL